MQRLLVETTTGSRYERPLMNPDYDTGEKINKFVKQAIGGLTDEYKDNSFFNLDERVRIVGTALTANEHFNNFIKGMAPNP